MKKLILFSLFILTIGLTAKAQDNDNKDKLKKTSTVPQKVHNTFSKHKKFSGYKTKHEHHGVKRKHKVNYKTGKVINKTT